MKMLHGYLDKELAKFKTKSPSDEQVKEAILNAFDTLEKEWVDLARMAFPRGYAQVAQVGACALVSIVHNNKIYTASAGDSKAVIYRENSPHQFERVKISKTFNANKKYEQTRLVAAFPKEEDVVVCMKGVEKACYVKGMRMPTRAFGDLVLKHAEFNFHSYMPGMGYQPPIPKG